MTATTQSLPPGVPASLATPQGNVPAVGIGTSQDYPRLVFSAPYFETIAIAEIIQPSVTEAVENVLPSLVPPYVDAAAQAAVQQLAVLLTGSTMTGPLFLSPLMPTQPSQAATMAYVDAMIATAGIPEVPPVPSGQVWARETGQWVPITSQTGVFLPLSGGSMVGNINMSGNTIQNMAAVPAMPNGAAPAQWVLNQIASVSLYQGTWDADNNTPDLTQLNTHVNGYTWIAITTAIDGVVIGPAIPGLQGQTIYNGDTIIYSTVQGSFMSIHAGGLTLPEADARYVQLGGSQMSGALLLNANASQPLQAVTLQQLQAFVPPGAVGEAPNDGQLYGRNGLTAAWSPVLPLAGGILTGSLTLAANATQPLQPATYGQMNSAITAAVAAYLPLSGAAMTGLMTLSGNASVGLNPVPLQQLTAMLATYVTSTQLTSALAAYVPLAGGVTMTGNLTLPTLTASNTLAINGTGSVFNVPNGTSNFGGQISTTTIVNSGNATVSGTATINDCTVSGTGYSLTVPNGGANITGPVLMGNILTVSGGTINCFSAGYGGITYFSGYHAMGFNWNATNSNIDFFVDHNYTGSISVNISDPRLKSNRAPLAIDALGVINEIALEQFDLTPPVADATPRHWPIGLISDQLTTVLPEAVTRPAIEGQETHDSVDTLMLVAALIGAVQQLSGRVGALEAR